VDERKDGRLIRKIWNVIPRHLSGATQEAMKNFRKNIPCLF
jgi:hypothetical protein